MITCEMSDNCKNAPIGSNLGSGSCYDCRFRDQDPGVYNHYWPINRKLKHPKAEAEKLQNKRERANAKLAQKRARDKAKITLQAKARRAEKVTERKIIQATKNSGRVNNDGDHTAAGFFALDTKLQTTRETPQIDWVELQKIRSQAAANQKPVGALVLRGKSGRSVIVIDEEDFGKILKALLR